MIDLSSGDLIDRHIVENDIQLILDPDARARSGPRDYDVSAAKLRCMVRVFRRYFGERANAELIRSLALRAHSLAERYEVNSYTRWTHFAAQIAYLTDGLSDTSSPPADEKFGQRGLLRTTGEESYRAIAEDIGQDLVSFPAKLEQPDLAVESAFIEWKRLGLNGWADTDDLEAVTSVLDANMTDVGTRRAWLMRARGIWPDPSGAEPANARYRSCCVVALVALLVASAAMTILGGGLMADLWGASYGNDVRTHAAEIILGAGFVVACLAAIALKCVRRDYRRGILTARPFRP